jgi:hypothetical protein
VKTKWHEVLNYKGVRRSVKIKVLRIGEACRLQEDEPAEHGEGLSGLWKVWGKNNKAKSFGGGNKKKRMRWRGGMCFLGRRITKRIADWMNE